MIQHTRFKFCPKCGKRTPNEEIAGVCFAKPGDINFSRIGFPSIRNALKRYAAHL